MNDFCLSFFPHPFRLERKKKKNVTIYSNTPKTYIMYFNVNELSKAKKDVRLNPNEKSQ